MTINPTGRSGSIQLDSNSTTSVRRSPNTDFGTQLRGGIAAGANQLGNAAGVAAPFVPGAAVVSAAVNGAAAGIGGGGQGAFGATAQSGGSTFVGDVPFSNSSNLSANNGTASSGSAQQDLMNQTKDMQEMMASFNLQYLQLQEKMQAENRSFSTVSNVMKTKHDTAKSSINNVR